MHCMNDARVVCRQLGYSGVIAVHARATFGRGEGPIHFDELNCNGHEERLIDCSHDGVGVHGSSMEWTSLPYYIYIYNI